MTKEQIIEKLESFINYSKKECENTAIADSHYMYEKGKIIAFMASIKMIKDNL